LSPVPRGRQSLLSPVPRGRQSLLTPYPGAARACSALHPGPAGEGGGSRVPGGVLKLVLDTQQLVVLIDALTAGGGTGLDLTGVHCHRQIGDGGVLGLPTAVGD